MGSFSVHTTLLEVTMRVCHLLTVNFIALASLSSLPGVISEATLCNLLADLSSCTVNFLEFTEIVDHSKILYPSVKTSIKHYDLSAYRNYFSAFSARSRYVTCYIAVLLVKGTEFIPGFRTKNDFVRSVSSTFKVSYKCIMLITTRFSKESFQHDFNFDKLIQITSLSPIYFFHYDLRQRGKLREQSVASSNQSLRTTLLKTESQQLSGTTSMKPRARTGTDVMSIQDQAIEIIGDAGEGSGHIKKGWFVCTYCIPLRPALYEFDCSMDTNCFSIALQKYLEVIDGGRNVLWNVYPDGWNYHPALYGAVVTNAFAINNVDNKVKTTIAYLLGGLNKTLLTEAWYYGALASKSKTHTPKIIRRVERMFGSGSLFPLGGGRTFVFITADGTHEVEGGTEFYLTPFSSKVWYYCLASLATLIVFFWVLYTASEGESLWHSVGRIITVGVETLFWSVGLLMEQHVGKTPSRTKDISVYRISAVALIFWLLGSMVITGLYRGMINASYAVEDPFKTIWTSIQELDNFTLYSSLGNCKNFPKLTQKVTSSSRPNVRTVCHLYPLEGKTDINCKFYNNLHEKLYAIENLESPTSKAKQKLELLRSLEERLVYTCDSYVPRLVRKELQRPGTAFVTSSNDFATYWEIFEKEHESNSSKKFANNNKKPDNFLEEWRGFYFTSLVDNTFMESRMSALQSSGMYWVWERWGKENRIRGPMRHIAKRDARYSHSKPLSLTNSDFGIIFYSHLKNVMVCTLIFVCEYLWGNKSRRKRKDAVEHFVL